MKRGDTGYCVRHCYGHVGWIRHTVGGEKKSSLMRGATLLGTPPFNNNTHNTMFVTDVVSPSQAPKKKYKKKERKRGGKDDRLLKKQIDRIPPEEGKTPKSQKEGSETVLPKWTPTTPKMEK